MFLADLFTISLKQGNEMFNDEFCLEGRICHQQTLPWGQQWELGRGSGDPEMPAYGGPKFGTLHFLTAPIFPPKSLLNFFKQKTMPE